MKIALFGGTFDPVHRGHLAVARAAAERFDLDLIHFVPADVPPHKLERPLTAFDHRFAMLALATAGDRRFVPSLLEANSGQPNYSIVTVRRLKQSLKRSDQLYFLIGMDAFKEIGTWRQPVDLLAECEFIVASRPGYSLADVGRALPEAIRPSETVLRAFRKQRAGGAIVLPGATIHLLNDVQERVSSTQIRTAANKNIRQLEKLVPKPVAEYIKKERLYVPVVQAQPEPRSKVLSFQRARNHQVRNRHS